MTKPFTRPEQVAPIVRELNGSKGPLRGFGASRDASTFSTSWSVHGKVDLRRFDLGVADDQQLVANLGNERVDVAGVEASVDAAARTGLRVRAAAQLPDGTARVVSAAPGRRVVLVASADDTAVGRLVLVVLGVAVAILAVTVLVLGEARARRRRARRSVRSGP